MTKKNEYPFFSPVDEALFQRRTVYLSGPVDSVLALNVNRQLLALEAENPEKPVYLFVNSPGGEINSGFSIYDTARFISCDVYTVVVGLAASMGSLISLAAPKERRLSFPNGKFLIHQPLVSGVIQGSASDIEIHAVDIVKTKEKINRLYAEETGRPFDEIVKATNRDNWMSAEEALDFGLISRIVNSQKEIDQ